MTDFDAIVVGGGHAGIEATRALSSRGFRVALITLDPTRIGAMSCNPAIGGVAKSHLVFEIDALGGWMGAAADQNSIQSRRLNLNKGPAVRSTRVQCDKDRYANTMTSWVRGLKNVRVIAGEGAELLHAGGQISGLKLKDGSTLSARAVVISAGTFMRGLMFCGELRTIGGRFGDSAAESLTKSISELGHQTKRLKTGTPARLKAETIDFSAASEIQWGDPEKRRFSWRDPGSSLPQLCCYMVHTNERTHEIIRQNFDKSPLFSGDIQGVGPRYCPSVEDKVKRFPDRKRHQIFLEPEGLDSTSIYPNGLSTSLPAEVQLEFLRSIPGLSLCELIRPGYAVEYDTINPTDLEEGLMSKFALGLFFAGQVNRSSGYEEAAAQGLWAGINASLYLEDQAQLSPKRSRSYIETLVSDLVNKGSDEPYRLFTSRSEYRLLLREDNAHERLLGLGRELGLVGDAQVKNFEREQNECRDLKAKIMRERKRLSEDRVVSYYEYLKRPEVIWEDLASEINIDSSDLALERIEIEAKYSGYLEKQESELRQLENIQSWAIDRSVDVRSIKTLSHEVIEKYLQHRPANVAELSSISGITPSAILAIAKVAGRKGGGFFSRETNPG